MHPRNRGNIQLEHHDLSSALTSSITRLGSKVHLLLIPAIPFMFQRQLPGMFVQAAAND